MIVDAVPAPTTLTARTVTGYAEPFTIDIVVSLDSVVIVNGVAVAPAGVQVLPPSVL
jgi:hypothetical protein